LSHHSILTDIFLAAVAGAAPGPVTAAALAKLSVERWTRVWLFAIGKAAQPQGEAAVAELERSGRDIAGGVLVGATDFPAPHPSLAVCAGDHPLPSGRSAAAGVRLGEVVQQVRAEDVALVLLSGGASSLVAAPIDGVDSADVAALFELLLGSGLDIARMNAVRKRFTRWSGGRLAVALPGAVYCLVVSDVIGDDLATIGSGPCVADPLRAAEVRRILEEAGLVDRVPAALLTHLARVERGDEAETPKPSAAAFGRVTTRIVASNRTALRAASARALAVGIESVVVASTPLAGEAAAQGRVLADELLALRVRSRTKGSGRRRSCVLWGGETTVTLAEPVGPGGRCQELALAAAGRFDEERADGITLLAAGTDGRDGPTDAAGAIVDAHTWRAVRRGGREPAHDLRAHAAYAALDAVGGLVRTGMTGTNVADVVVGLVDA
jgi:glycerate-2-kinase